MLPPDLVPYRRTAEFTESTVPAGLLGEGVTIAAREADPQGLTALGRPELPVRQLIGELTAQMIMGQFQPLPRRRTQPVKIIDQFGGDQLAEHAAADVLDRSDPGQSVDQRARRSYPVPDA